MNLWAELAGENPDLALCELTSSNHIVSPGASAPEPVPWGVRLCSLTTDAPGVLAGRLAYTHRLLRPLAQGTWKETMLSAREEGAHGLSAAIRVIGSSGALPGVPEKLGEAYVRGGGRIDLDRPQRTLVIAASNSKDGSMALLEEVAKTARMSLKKRPPTTLKFRKPVTLSPLLARALVNLAEVPPGGYLLDPFCGTGAMLIEGGLLGCRLVAADVDGRMLKGTLANLSTFGLTPDKAIQTDIGGLGDSLEGAPSMDGAATDPPYGRSSTTRGEEATRLLQRSLETLQSVLKKGSRLALMVPSTEGVKHPPEGWILEGAPIPLPVHRSLTRWVCVLRT